MIKNFPKNEAVQLRNMLMYSPGQSLTKTFVDTPDFSMIMHSLWHDGEMILPADDRDIFITCMEGALIVSLQNKELYIVRHKELYIVRQGESLLIETDQEYRIIAKQNCKFLIINTRD